MPANSTGLRRFQIPRVKKSILVRPRVLLLLEDTVDYSLVIVKAGPGYGKTTAVSNYVRASRHDCLWFTLTEEERNPTTFITQFMMALFPGGTDEALAQAITEAMQHPLTSHASADWAAQMVSEHYREETLIVFDDFHAIAQSETISNWVDRWLRGLPFHVHVILITRTVPDTLPYVEELDNKGDVLWVREPELLFTAQEVEQLFSRRTGRVEQGDSSTEEERFDRDFVFQKSGGLAIVLTMLHREWQLHASWDRIEQLLSGRSTLREQIGRLLLSDCSPQHIEFLADCSFLTVLSAEACNYVTESKHAEEYLRRYEKRGLLLTTGAVGTYALHPFVREYLQSQLDGSHRREAVWRTVKWFYESGDVARALGYVFYLPDESEAVDELLKHMSTFLASGFISTVESWLSQLSTEMLSSRPELLLMQAEVARAKNQFPGATRLYHRARVLFAAAQREAGVAQTFLGEARLFLDTIQPSLAKECLRSARRGSKCLSLANRLRLIRMEYENAVNRGWLQRALRLERNLTQFGVMAETTAQENTDARLLLRTGQLAEAIFKLKDRANFQPEGPHRLAQSHREATLILSLLYSMAGQAEDAINAARAGYRIGNQLQSPFVRAVGSIRLGHALHLRDPFSEPARLSYESALRDMDELGTVRGKSEAYLGLTFVLGYQGEFTRAREAALEGMRIAHDVEDAWMENLVRLALGQIYVLAGDYENARETLNDVTFVSIQCRDRFLHAAGLMWRSLVHFKTGNAQFVDDIVEAHRLAEAGGFVFLFERPTLFGFRDLQTLVPLLQAVCHHDGNQSFAANLARQLCPLSVEVHPGFTLRIQTFGDFRLWRGFLEIPRKAWTREKARQLLQYLVTQGDTARHREEIASDVWETDDPQVAERDFKVALNGLKTVLEPDSQVRGTTVFVHREGSFYRLLKSHIVQIDRVEFERLLDISNHTSGVEKERSLLAAIELYRGDYLPDARYALWSLSERDRLRNLFMRACMTYADLLLHERRWDEVIRIAERMAQIDVTSEEAYVFLIQAYGHQKMRHMVAQVYHSCVSVLQRELGTSPLKETTALYERFIQG